MYRSASTFIHNVARVAHQHAGQTTWSGGFREFTNTDGTEADVYVVKEHRWIKALADYADIILVSERPIKQAWRSKCRFKNREIPWTKTEDWIEWLTKYQSHPRCMYCMHWEDFMDDGGAWRALKDIIHVLDLNVNPRHVMRHLRSELAPPTTGRKDPDSLVFHNHYGRGWDKVKNRLYPPKDETDDASSED